MVATYALEDYTVWNLQYNARTYSPGDTNNNGLNPFSCSPTKSTTSDEPPRLGVIELFYARLEAFLRSPHDCVNQPTCHGSIRALSLLKIS